MMTLCSIDGESIYKRCNDAICVVNINCDCCEMEGYCNKADGSNCCEWIPMPDSAFRTALDFAKHVLSNRRNN